MSKPPNIQLLRSEVSFGRSNEMIVLTSQISPQQRKALLDFLRNNSLSYTEVSGQICIQNITQSQQYDLIRAVKFEL